MPLAPVLVEQELVPAEVQSGCPHCVRGARATEEQTLRLECGCTATIIHRFATCSVQCSAVFVFPFRAPLAAIAIKQSVVKSTMFR